MSAPPNVMQQMMAPPSGPRLAEEGEWVDMPLSDDTIEETPDGGADIILVRAGERVQTADQDSFYDNLVESLPEQYLIDLCSDLLDKIEIDKQARSKRDEQYAEGLRRSGVGKDAPGGADFEGASRAVHPMLTKSSIDFGARMMKEIFPAQGPCKSAIFGDVTKQRVEKGKRLSRYYNWLTTTQMVEFRPALEQTGTQSALSGVQYMRLRWDHGLRRPSSQVVHSDNLFMPYDALSLWAAERITFQDDISAMEYKRRVRDGIYRDVDVVPPSLHPDESKSAQARAKGEGKEPDVRNVDGIRRTYEVNTYLDDLEDSLSTNVIDLGKDKGRLLPYLIFIDESTRQVAGIFRNWEKTDAKKARMHWIVEWPFIPWVGAYPIGLVHVIGSLSGAATGALRALLDAGHIAIQNTGYALKGANVSGQTQQVKVSQLNYLKGGVGGDDIRKLFMPVTPQAPSPTLFQLLTFLIGEAEGLIRTAFEDLQENNPNAPVGTTYAQIEQGLVVVSSIIGRMHFSMFNTLQVLHRISRMYVTDAIIKDDAGEILAYRADFLGPCDVIPVSDPGMPSDAHRMAQMQTVAQRADLKPMLYNQRRVEKMILERLRIPDPDSYLTPISEPQEMNAANENAALAFGKPIVPYPHQDHLAHIKAHIDFMNNPLMGSMMTMAPKVIPPMLEHLTQHVALWYLGRIYHVVQQATRGNLDHYMQITDDAVKSEIDRTIAMASQQVAKEAQQVLGQLPQVIQQAQQLMSKIAPPPQDPRIAGELQREQLRQQGHDKDRQQRAQDSQARLQDAREQRQSDAQQAQQDQQGQNIRHLQSARAKMAETGMKERGQGVRHIQGIQSDQRIAAMHEMAENMRAAQSNQTKERINLEDNENALEISRMEIAAGKHSRLSTGRGISKEGRGVTS